MAYATNFKNIVRDMLSSRPLEVRPRYFPFHLGPGDSIRFFDIDHATDVAVTFEDSAALLHWLVAQEDQRAASAQP